MIGLLSAITGWLLFAALVITLGSLVARWILIPRATPDDPATAAWLRSAAGRLGLWGSGLLALALALVFCRQLLEFRDPFVPWSEEAHLLLTGTAWGTTWLWGAAASVSAVVVFSLVRAGVATAWWSATALVLFLGAFPGLTGHAASTEELRALTLSADALHVYAAGSWVGGLAFVLHAERAWRVQGRAGSLLPMLVPVFSPVAIACVAVLASTGGLAAWVQLDGIGDLFSTTYGRLLTLKLAIVAGVLGLGWVSWKRLTPRLGEASGAHALRRNAMFELLTAGAVLLVTAILVHTSPLGH